jgi:hypothetical protein
MSTKCEFGSWPLEEVNDAIEQAILRPYGYLPPSR